MSKTIEQKIPAYAYYRLSKEESNKFGESTSITNQRSIVENYCKNNGYLIVKEFVDDGYSGGTFNRPGFNEMLNALEFENVKVVLTKDLSRLGRNMQESSYYVETIFPENGIKYIAISDNIDSDNPNPMTPFYYAMNDSYLRDGSRKVREAKKNMRENGDYCAAPPFGYKKNPKDKNKLIVDENTSHIVQKIFSLALDNLSTRKIAEKLNEEGVITPSMYKVSIWNFSEAGASRASQIWNYTTVKRILRNEVYLGHTILGKTEKLNYRSKKKRIIPKENWAITPNTHEPLVSENDFWIVQGNLKKKTKDYQEHPRVRKSIFSGLIFCSNCGHALCSCGTVYKGEREKYWYLSCSNNRIDSKERCEGTRIHYMGLLEAIKSDLNSLISLSDIEIDKIVKRIISDNNIDKIEVKRKKRIDEINKRLKQITECIKKTYIDNVSGLLSDEQYKDLVVGFNNESHNLKTELGQLNSIKSKESVIDNYKMFFDLVKNRTTIKTLDRDTVVDFIERIEVGPKILPDGIKKATHRNSPFEQKVKIYYKFIGELSQGLLQETT